MGKDGAGERPLAVNKTRAAELLGVSVDFFDVHIVPELRSVRRGKRLLYAVSELESWLERNATAPAPSLVVVDRGRDRWPNLVIACGNHDAMLEGLA